MKKEVKDNEIEKKENNEIMRSYRRDNYDIVFKIGNGKEKMSKRREMDMEINNKMVLSNLKETVRINYLFFGSIILISFIFGDNWREKIQIGSTFLFTGLIGYYIHYFAHNFSWNKYYYSHDMISKTNKYTDSIAKNIMWFLDFHRKTHHDSKINKQFHNIALEFVNNMVMEGLVIIIFIYFSRKLSIESIIIWCLTYASVHNINYLMYPERTHELHHRNPKTNFGADYYDILLGTKNKDSKLENYNHMGINIVIISFIVFGIKKWFIK